DAVWGDFAIQTYAYLAGAYTHEEYGAMLASLLGAEQPEQVTESWDYWGSGEYWEGGGFVDDFAGYEGYAGYQEGYVDDGGGQMYYGRDNSISFGSTTSVDDMVGSTVIY
ncbi:MAG TPA: hypothetical protein VEI97_07320, partial [bacterium]|nr:hypothetical protein [bacterium]